MHAGAHVAQHDICRRCLPTFLLCCTLQVTVSGLTPGTTYYYKVGDPAKGVSAVFSFKVCESWQTTVRTLTLQPSHSQHGLMPSDRDTLYLSRRLAQGASFLFYSWHVPALRSLLQCTLSTSAASPT